MKLKENSSSRKLRGAYYTPLPLVRMMVNMFENDSTIKKILEPSCGDGRFVESIIGSYDIERIDVITAIEIDKNEAKQLEDKWINEKKICIENKDFFDYYKKNGEKDRYDLIVGNPPYIRYQYLSEKQKNVMSSILSEHGMKSNKLINSWVGFMVACVHLLNDNGKIAFVIPAEILQVAYAKDLRLFLADNLAKITLVTFKELIFPDIEQEVVIFLGEKGEYENGIRIIELNNLNDINRLNIESYKYQKIQHVHEKWTKYFTNDNENELIRSIRNNDKFQKFSDVAVINVGITTGNNKYFSVTKDVVEQYNLRNITRPLIGRSSHAHSIYFNVEDWLVNVNNSKAAFLIDFPDTEFDDYLPLQKEYIRLGEEKGENKGYKCSIRERWYCIPSIWVPDAFFLRRNNLYPKLVLNRCNAVSTDTMHRIKFNEGIEFEKIILSYYNSISFAFVELCGRSYGGGVLEILPSEVGNIMIPKLDNIPISLVRSILQRIDILIRENHDVEEVLDIVDYEVLVGMLSINIETCKNARMIWKKMQRRRLNRK